MTGENEREADEARLHALIEKALAAGDLPESLLKVTSADLKALDPERVARIKAAVKSGDLEGLERAVETPTPRKGFNRGDVSEPRDAGLDAARERVKGRVRRQRHGPESPEAPTEPR